MPGKRQVPDPAKAEFVRQHSLRHYAEESARKAKQKATPPAEGEAEPKKPAQGAK